jgi:hypothetical protein
MAPQRPGEILAGTASDDVYVGGKTDDIFQVAGGHDVIDDSAKAGAIETSNDAVHFTDASASLDNLKLATVSGNLVVGYGTHGDTVTIDNILPDALAGQPVLDQLVFANGSRTYISPTDDGGWRGTDYDSSGKMIGTTQWYEDGSRNTNLDDGQGNTQSAYDDANGYSSKSWSTSEGGFGYEQTDASGNSFTSIYSPSSGWERSYAHSDGSWGASQDDGQNDSYETDYAANGDFTTNWTRGSDSHSGSGRLQAGQLTLGGSLAPDQFWFSRSGNDLEIVLLGSGDQMSVANWFGSGASHLRGIVLSDGESIVAAQINQLVDAMSQFSPPLPGEAQYTPVENQALAPLVASSWH